MLPSDHRLRRREDFAAAVRQGRRAGRSSLVVHLMTPSAVGAGAERRAVEHTSPHAAGEPVSPARAGFVVSKAVGNAVVRNRVKRRLRHLVGTRLNGLPPGSLIVVRALPSAATTDFAGLERDLDSALRKLAASREPRGGNPRSHADASTSTGTSTGAGP